jgi:hypothetical protein
MKPLEIRKNMEGKEVARWPLHKIGLALLGGVNKSW